MRNARRSRSAKCAKPNGDPGAIRTGSNRRPPHWQRVPTPGFRCAFPRNRRREPHWAHPRSSDATRALRTPRHSGLLDGRNVTRTYPMVAEHFRMVRACLRAASPRIPKNRPIVVPGSGNSTRSPPSTEAMLRSASATSPWISATEPASVAVIARSPILKIPRFPNS